MNYYERHLGDYAKDTAHLTMIEHGAYCLLLDRYYGTDKGIPVDQAHRIARARTKDEKLAVDAVLTEFFRMADGVWINKRAEEEIEKAFVKINAAKENGKKGGRPKKINPEDEKETQEKPTGLFVGSESETQQKAHQSPVTSHQTNTGDIPSPISNPALTHGDDEKPSSPAEWIEVFAEQHGVDVDHRNFHDRKKFWPLASAWSNAGVTVGQMRAACSKAHGESKESIAWLPAYADRVLASMQSDKKPGANSAQVPTFKQRDARDDWKRWEEMHSEIHPDRLAEQNANVIDVTPTILEIKQ
jgi:uncharacterized protein YdaU (DUF1376 family)